MVPSTPERPTAEQLEAICERAELLARSVSFDFARIFPSPVTLERYPPEDSYRESARVLVRRVRAEAGVQAWDEEMAGCRRLAL